MTRWIVIGLAAIAIILAASAYYTNTNRPVVAPPSNNSNNNSGSSGDIPLGTLVSYKNADHNFSILHPDQIEVTQKNFDGYLPLTASPVVGFVLPDDLYRGTNLGEAGVYIGVSSKPAIVASCIQTSKSNGETMVGTATFKGSDWTVFTSHDAAAGNIYEKYLRREDLPSSARR
jgi:hypothetical protein